MPIELEERLETAANLLPRPTEEVSVRARRTALAALPGGVRAGGIRTRPRVGRVLAGSALVGIAALVLLLVAPWKGRSPLATERALAAMGDQPVIHAVIERLQPQSTTIDLTSGATRAQFERTELWYDGVRSLFRVRFTVGGRLLSELLQTPHGSFSPAGAESLATTAPRLDPALAGFATRYRSALKSGQAKVVGAEEIDGRKAILLRILLRAGTYEDVAVDAHSYRPLQLRYIRNAGKPAWQQRIIWIETLPRTKHQFVRPERSTTPRPVQQAGTDAQVLSPSQAATALKQHAYWPGIRVSGVTLNKLALVRLTTRWSDGRQTKTSSLDFEYGPARRARLSANWFRISEGTSRKESLRYSFLDLPPLPRGELRLAGAGSTDGAPSMWFGAMRKGGVYIFVQSPRRNLVLSAARSMTPIP